MSRTYKDMPERVWLTRHRETAPVRRVHAWHNCAPHGGRFYAESAPSVGTYSECDIDEVKNPGADPLQHCQWVFSAGFYYSKPDYRDAVRDKVNAPLRGQERKFATEAIKDHRAGVEDAERDVLIHRRTNHGPLGGGYWW